MRKKIFENNPSHNLTIIAGINSCTLKNFPSKLYRLWWLLYGSEHLLLPLDEVWKLIAALPNVLYNMPFIKTGHFIWGCYLFFWLSNFLICTIFQNWLYLIHSSIAHCDSHWLQSSTILLYLKFKKFGLLFIFVNFPPFLTTEIDKLNF